MKKVEERSKDKQEGGKRWLEKKQVRGLEKKEMISNKLKKAGKKEEKKVC